MGALKKVDKGAGLAPLAKECDELAQVKNALLPGIKRLLKSIKNRGEDNGGIVLSADEARSIKTLDLLYQRMIQAAKASAEIERIDSDQVTDAYVQRVVDNIEFYVFQGIEWEEPQIGTELSTFLLSKAKSWFRPTVNVGNAVGAIIKVAQGPNKRLQKSLARVWDKGVLFDTAAPKPGAPVEVEVEEAVDAD